MCTLESFVIFFLRYFGLSYNYYTVNLHTKNNESPQRNKYSHLSTPQKRNYKYIYSVVASLHFTTTITPNPLIHYHSLHQSPSQTEPCDPVPVGSESCSIPGGVGWLVGWLRYCVYVSSSAIHPPLLRMCCS